jgi:diguanylate cyclase (GGDEF)-like protein
MRLIPAVALLLGWASAACAAPPATLTSLHDIRQINNDVAATAVPVSFECTVTYFAWYAVEISAIFVQDGQDAIYVVTQPGLKLALGDRVLIQGKTHAGFRPEVIADSVTLIHHDQEPVPQPVTFPSLISGELDCKWVSVHATVRSADIVTHGQYSSIYLELLMDGGTIRATVLDKDLSHVRELIDNQVEINGVVQASFDTKTSLIGIVLGVPTLADVKILKRPDSSLETLPLTPVGELIGAYNVRDFSRRVRVKGTITYQLPGQAVVLQNGAQSLWIATLSEQPLHIGDVADATGFPDVRNGSLMLTEGEIRDSHKQAPVTPKPLAWTELLTGANIFDLVSVEGQVMVAARAASQDEYILSSEGHLFSAIYRHPGEKNNLTLPPMKLIPLGSRVRVTGVCLPSYGSDPFQKPVSYDILLRNFDDVAVIVGPSLLNTRNLLLALGALLIVVFVVTARGWALEHKVRRQTAVMSARSEIEVDLERQRSRILEDINESRPLAEILMQIAAMVSSTLGGAPCWCEVTDGEKLGDCPEDQNNLRIVRASIDAHVGPALGTLFAALNPDMPPIDRETVALQNGARLATLAVETRRLYSDLRRRSEYDLLTDIPNRFAIEKFIDLQIEEARQSGRILGLIFIDLDEFKLVNDTYGHHVGDFYLQEAALRMSRQLLGRDMLARLGGDEFAALVSLHNGLADLSKIVARLEHCFDRPFDVGGYLLNGAASIGVALYPEEGTTKDSLLSAADAAMYTVKNKKHKSDRSPAKKPHPESPSEDRA